MGRQAEGRRRIAEQLAREVRHALEAGPLARTGGATRGAVLEYY